MNRADPQIREMLAAEYVIGTLRGAARDRFEGLLSHDAALDAMVHGWARRLDRYNHGLAPVRPPTHVWRAVAARIAADSRPRLDTDRRVGFWRALAIAASLALVFAVGALLVPQRVPLPDYVALIANAKGAPQWMVQADLQHRRLVYTPLHPVAPPAGKAYELWLLPARGAPVPMGVLPVAAPARIEMRHGDMMATAKGLAVSVEPPGGSPTGAPTGPVVYQAALVKAF